MTQPTPRALCLALHDVAEPTWPECRQLLDAMRAVADIPVTLLVTPRFHGAADPPSAWFVDALHERAGRGDELALHGWFHVDEQPVKGPVDRLRRRFYTRSEGEFSSLDQQQAHTRIETGRDWFSRHDLRASGFVAPAWLMNEPAWQALASEPFDYTTTLNRIWRMPQRAPIEAPCLTYSTATALLRAASKAWLSWLALRSPAWPIVRLGLHPADAHHPQVVRHWQSLLARLLEGREAMTKQALVERLRTSWR
ncbi:DUF2334 domain-containing protein [soil metagenome]